MLDLDIALGVPFADPAFLLSLVSNKEQQNEYQEYARILTSLSITSQCFPALHVQALPRKIKSELYSFTGNGMEISLIETYLNQTDHHIYMTLIRLAENSANLF